MSKFLIVMYTLICINDYGGKSDYRHTSNFELSQRIVGSSGRCPPFVK